MPSAACHVCHLGENPADDRIVYRDDLWTAAGAAPVPGWVMLALNRHNDGVWELTDPEAAGLGRLVTRLSGAIRESCDAERVYLLYAGENALHFHLLLMARDASVPEEWRGGPLVDHHADLVDPDEADRVLKAVRHRMSAPATAAGDSAF